MGNLEAQSTAHEILDIWKPKYIFVVGIAGGNFKKDVVIKDIVVAKSVVYYELGKYGPNGVEIRSAGSIYQTSQFLVDRIANCETIKHRRVHFGTVASGEKVIAQDEFRDQILKVMPDTLAFEMESAGVAKACQKEGIEFISIRGICDAADPTKSDAFREKAIQDVAQFLTCWLNEKPFESIYRSIDLQTIHEDARNQIVKQVKDFFPHAKKHLHTSIENYLGKMKTHVKERLPPFFLDSHISKVDFDYSFGIQVVKEAISSFSSFGNLPSLGPLSVIIGKSGYGKTSLLLSRFLSLCNGNKNSKVKIPLWIEREDLVRYDPVTSVALTVNPYVDVSDKAEIGCYRSLIEKGVFEIIIDDIAPFASPESTYHVILDRILEHMRYYLRYNNRLVVSCLYPDAPDLSGLKPDYYLIDLPTKEQVRRCLPFIPTPANENMIDILRIPLLFSMYLKLKSQSKATFSTRTGLVRYYVEREMDRTVPDIEARKGLRNSLIALASDLKKTGTRKFSKEDFLKSSDLGAKKMQMLANKLLLSSLFRKRVLNNDFEFLHSFVQDYFVALEAVKRFGYYWRLFLSNYDYWLQTVVFACSISQKAVDRAFDGLVKLYETRKDMRFLFYALLCTQEIEDQSLRERRMQIISNKMIDSLSIPDENFYVWLPELMNSMLGVNSDIVDSVLSNYILKNIDSIIPKMINFIHYSPNILKRNPQLKNKLLEKIRTKPITDYHLVFSIIEVFRINNIRDCIPALLDMYSGMNPILRSQIIYTLEHFKEEKSIHQELGITDIDAAKSQLKKEIVTYLDNQDPYMVGHSIIECVRLDCAGLEEEIIKVLLNKTEPVIRYHALYGLQFAMEKIKESMLATLKLAGRNDIQERVEG